MTEKKATKNVKEANKEEPIVQQEPVEQNTSSQAIDESAQQVETNDDEHSKQRYRRKRLRLRMIPIWLRIFLSIVLIGGSFLVGLMVGFGIVGDGDNPAEILKPDLWYYLMDMIRGR
ncbi:DNA-directed RNA polymerase subunit beta [Halalkalibacter sp. APA_J-10(15)]|uniref:DNA-directed RNA polymerase subunit beta n=1 Tax=unclassified Halalkalibacter TaxID=2893063 RepID=UPI001FF49585|nr:DNA-directed RNA polymerase subunit beta [Halalkalibacter sp. APA_J-10(15)]MCK0470062.1 DNA-directed RNA polymerase subunit beta [Halalkalibacter sp. APA_J-10(15)]